MVFFCFLLPEPRGGEHLGVWWIWRENRLIWFGLEWMDDQESTSFDFLAIMLFIVIVFRPFLCFLRKRIKFLLRKIFMFILSHELFRRKKNWLFFSRHFFFSFRMQIMQHFGPKNSSFVWLISENGKVSFSYFLWCILPKIFILILDRK
jgi:hypothetical protein